MSASQFIEQLDAAVSGFLATWNITTTLLAGGLFILLIWPLITGKDPDIHPFLLARQAQSSPVRQEGESALYRSTDIPYGYPLRKGLGFKDPGSPKWAPGRDGDLRDIWRTALRGPVDASGVAAGQRGKLLSIRGKEEPTTHEFGEVTRSINVIGKYVQENGGKKVVVCLSNSVELLVTVFASAFYGFKLVLVPHGLDQNQLTNLLTEAAADFLIGEAGSIELGAVTKAAPTIQHAIWVANPANRDMDWNEVPAGMGGKIELATWHELVEERKATASVEAPENDTEPASISLSSTNASAGYELCEFSSANIIAGVGGLISTVARNQKLTNQDIVLPTSSLSDSYTLCWVLMALYSNATVALNSVAGQTVDIFASTSTVKPTIIITSSTSIETAKRRLLSTGSSGLSNTINSYFTRRSLNAGILTPTFRPAAPVSSSLSNLRLLFISQPDTSARGVLESSFLFTLRLRYGVRIGYALTTGRVAGGVLQTNVLDYRSKGSVVNVGVPLTSVEVLLKGKEESGTLTGETPRGRINVSGPAVAGKKVALNVDAQVETDHTFTLLY